MDFDQQEFTEVINEMKDSSPGPNGLTRLFFKKFFPLFSNYFVKTVNMCHVFTPNQFKISYIKLIPKNNYINKTIDDFRPITVTNYEYRLYAKVLIKRLKRYNDLIFDEQQICSIKNRKIDDIIHLLRDLIHDSKLKNKDLKIIPVDQKKAFDNLDHDYLFELLENINIGQKMIKIIKNLYVMAKTTINMDGNLLGEIIIEKGIKQGDPLSMWLYTIAIQELFLII